jgi:hypothetical protein
MLKGCLVLATVGNDGGATILRIFGIVRRLFRRIQLLQVPCH